MSGIHVSVSRVIDAPADVVYGILADYRVGHPAVLPKPYFKELVVEEGGRGEGTVARVDMEVMGAKRTMRLRVTEPEPGRVLREEDTAAGVVTVFTVEPLADGRSRVTFDTDMRASDGIGGWLERRTTPFFMRRIYHGEQALLADMARARARGGQ